MENHDTQNGQSNAEAKLSQGSTDIQANASPHPSDNPPKKPYQRKNKKWTLRQHWKHANAAKRAKWIFEGLSFVVGLLILANYIWGNLIVKRHGDQEQRNFITEHRPKVILSRTIEFAKNPRPDETKGTITCTITGRYVTAAIGTIRVWARNTSNTDAVDTFSHATPFLVAEPKVGFRPFDDPEMFPKDACELTHKSEVKMMPIHHGEEAILKYKGSGVQWLPEGKVFPEQTRFNFYANMCVEYSGQDSIPYSTCMLYRLAPIQMDGSPINSIPCDGTTFTGEFQPVWGKYCEK